MMEHYTRNLSPRNNTFFLFGPRGTGKTTWLLGAYRKAFWLDLLDHELYFAILKNPAYLRELLADRPEQWVVVDEIQRVPALLHEIHYLMNRNKKLRFALTGSSARKLRREGVNLLAGRAEVVRFAPFSYAEVGAEWNLEKALRFGLLPRSFVADTDEERIRFLNAYVITYLREEIQQEAAVKNLDTFTRFLEVAAILNGQTLNIAAVARDAGVARPTVQGYFKVLEDTLVSFMLPAWKTRAKVREAAHPKFYFFDTGVVNALRGSLREPIDSVSRGWLLETCLLHEIRVAAQQLGYDENWGYWRLPSDKEVDLIWKSHGKTIGVEIKSGPKWRREYAKSLDELVSLGKIGKAYGVYLGKERLKDGAVTVLPVQEFLQRLHAGKLF